MGTLSNPSPEIRCAVRFCSARHNAPHGARCPQMPPWSTDSFGRRLPKCLRPLPVGGHITQTRRVRHRGDRTRRPVPDSRASPHLRHACRFDVGALRSDSMGAPARKSQLPPKRRSGHAPSPTDRPGVRGRRDPLEYFSPQMADSRGSRFVFSGIVYRHAADTPHNRGMGVTIPRSRSA